jgi:hypothetical protein
VTRIYAQMEVQPRNTAAGEAAWQEASDRASQIDDFIHAAPPGTPAGAAVKLRRLLDPEVGLPASDETGDFSSMLLILDFLHSVAGRPTHLTRAVWRGGEDTDWKAV